MVSSAGIYGLNGEKWASYKQEVGKDGVETLVKAFLDPTDLYRNGEWTAPAALA